MQFAYIHLILVRIAIKMRVFILKQISNDPKFEERTQYLHEKRTKNSI